MRKSHEYNKYNIERSIKVQGVDVNCDAIANNFTAENRIAYITFKILHMYIALEYVTICNTFYCLCVYRANLHWRHYAAIFHA